MAKEITIFFDEVANSLDVWFVKPKEAVCEERDDFVIKKDMKTKEVIGFEKLNFSSEIPEIKFKVKKKIKK